MLFFEIMRIYCIAMILFVYVDGSTVSRSSTFQNHNKAEEYYNHAMYLASNGMLEDSMPFFRAAVRLNPHNVNYVHDLGVTEAQLGYYLLAEKRFLASLRLDAQFSDAAANLRRVQHDMKSHNIVSSAACSNSQRKHTITPISAISIDELNTHYMQHPFIIRNFTHIMNWSTNEIMQRILTSHPDAITDYYPQNMLTIPTKVFFLPLASAWEQLNFPDGLYADIDASFAGTYFQWNMNSGEWSSVTSLLDASFPQLLYDPAWQKYIQDSETLNHFMKQTHWNMLLVGEENSGMFNHVDTLRTASFQVQLQGRKKWHICGPDNAQYMYRPGDVDSFHPEYDVYPLFSSASCVEETIYAGDLIFYPHDHWHQTLNLDTSIALSSTVLTKECYHEVLAVLASECEQSKNYQLRDTFCQELDKLRGGLHDLFVNL